MHIFGTCLTYFNKISYPPFKLDEGISLDMTPLKVYNSGTRVCCMPPYHSGLYQGTHTLPSLTAVCPLHVIYTFHLHYNLFFLFIVAITYIASLMGIYKCHHYLSLPLLVACCTSTILLDLHAWVISCCNFQFSRYSFLLHGSST